MPRSGYPDHEPRGRQGQAISALGRRTTGGDALSFQSSPSAL